MSCFASPRHCRKEGTKSNPDSAILTLKIAVTLIFNYMALMLVHIKLLNLLKDPVQSSLALLIYRKEILKFSELAYLVFNIKAYNE